MKRYGNLYEKVYDMDNLKKAHQKAKVGKGWLKHCNSYRLYQKYSAPLQEHSDYYYTHYIKGGTA